MSKIDNTNISKVLGKRVDAPKTYDKAILVREPRSGNREYLNIKDGDLPFVGVDVWNNWEISALTDTGLPVSGIAKITYPCSSKYIVESKSAKLYFNSFNMTKFGKTPKQVINNIERSASKDLSEFLETKVTVKIFSAAETAPLTHAFFKGYTNIDLCSPSLKTDVYNEDATLLSVVQSAKPKTQKFCSSLLRSNCRVTGQPDAGDVYIHMTGVNQVEEKSLLKYIISFRNECHFHEEICECIFTRLKEIYKPTELLVLCLYVRRGSLDINPIRSTHMRLIPDFLIKKDLKFVKTPRQ